MEPAQPTIESVFNALTSTPQTSSQIALQINAYTIPTLKVLESLRQQGLAWVTPASEWIRARGAKLPTEPEPTINPLESKFSDRLIKQAERILKKEQSVDPILAALGMKTLSVPEATDLFDHLVTLGKAEKRGDRWVLPGAFPEQPVSVTPDPEPQPEPQPTEKPKPSERARAVFLENPENQYLTDSVIAARAQASAPTVALVRKRLLAEGLINSNGKRIDKRGRKITTDNIGRKIPLQNRLLTLIEDIGVEGIEHKELAKILESVLKPYIKP